MLENKKFMGTYYSRIIASWVRAGGYKKYGFGDEFKDWLRSLEMFENQTVVYHGSMDNVTDLDGNQLERHKMDEETVAEIYEMATCGKMEYESKVRKWLSTH